MYADEIWNLLYDQYLPFRLHGDYRQGTSIDDLATQTGMPAHWIRERIAAVEDSIESGQKLAAPFFDRRAGESTQLMAKSTQLTANSSQLERIAFSQQEANSF